MTAYDFDRAAQYFRDRLSFTTGVHELQVLITSDKRPENYQVVDVRYPADFATSRIPGAINLPKGQWKNVRVLDKDATIYLYCYTQTCHLAAQAAVELAAQGYKVVEVEGGWDTWVKSNFPVDEVRLKETKSA